MKKSAQFWIVCSGVIWFAVGIFLLLIGVKRVVFSSIEGASHSALFAEMAKMLKSRERSALILVTAGLLLGFMKGRFVLSKTVIRVVGRIRTLPEPIGFFDVYSLGYFALIASMMFLGMMMRWLSVPSDIHGVIDIGVGSALMNGAMFYFRSVLKKRKADHL